MIRDGMAAALADDAAKKLLPLADSFELELWYTDQHYAINASQYPGARLHDPHAIKYQTRDFFEIMRILSFVLEPPRFQ
jgi:D-amino peptidase